MGIVCFELLDDDTSMLLFGQYLEERYEAVVFDRVLDENFDHVLGCSEESFRY